MKFLVVISILLSVGSCCAMEHGLNKNQLIQIKKTSSDDLLRNQLNKNHNIGFAWCVSGVASASVALRLNTLCGSLSGSGYHKITKRLFYALVVSTIFSIGAMLKYANKNKRLLEDSERKKL